MTQLMQYQGVDGSQKNKVCVAVRFRPLRCAAAAACRTLLPQGSWVLAGTV